MESPPGGIHVVRRADPSMDAYFEFGTESRTASAGSFRGRANAERQCGSP